MFLLLLFSFFGMGSFEWEEVELYEPKAITKQIRESSVVKGYGKGVLKKSLIYFNDEIFECGDQLVIPENAEILRVPAGMEVKKTDIEIVKHDRYKLTYKEGSLKDEWASLKSESARLMGVSSFKTISNEQIYKFIAKQTSDGANRVKSKRRGIMTSKYPTKCYLSFILIDVNGKRELIPVVLAISPLSKLLKSTKLS